MQEQDIPRFLGIVDKFERDRPEECQRKLDAFHISRGDLVAFIENPPAGASERYDILLKDLEARGLDGYVRLDLSVVRGLAYYTGLVFEIFDTQRSLRAVAGRWPLRYAGGRPLQQRGGYAGHRVCHGGCRHHPPH